MKSLTLKKLMATITKSGVLDFLKISPTIFFLPSVVIHPSNICNFDCIMCPESSSKIQNKITMEFSLLKKLLYECSKYPIKPYIHYSGHGEPLVYQHMTELIKLTNKLKLKWGLTTNGFLLKNYARDITENSCNSIIISIHNIHQNNDKITCTKDSFYKAIEGIKEIDLLNKKCQRKKPVISLNSVINNDNVKDLKDILNELQKLPVADITFQHLMFSREDLTEGKSFLLEENQFKHLIDFMKFAKNQKNVQFYPDLKIKDIEGYYSVKNYPFKKSCIFPWLSSLIYPNGDVKICGVILGNLHEKTLKSIINSREAVRFRRLVKGNILNHDFCFRCCHRRYH